MYTNPLKLLFLFIHKIQTFWKVALQIHESYNTQKIIGYSDTHTHTHLMYITIINWTQPLNNTQMVFWRWINFIIEPKFLFCSEYTTNTYISIFHADCSCGFWLRSICAIGFPFHLFHIINGIDWHGYSKYTPNWGHDYVEEFLCYGSDMVTWFFWKSITQNVDQCFFIFFPILY